MDACDYKNLIRMKHTGHTLIRLIKVTGGVEMQDRGYNCLVEDGIPPINQMRMHQKAQVFILHPGKVFLDEITWSIAIQQIKQSNERKKALHKKAWQKRVNGAGKTSLGRASFGYNSELIARLLEYCSYGHALFD